MKSIENLKKYKNPYFFKRYSTYEDYLNHQASLYVNDNDLEDLKLKITSNSLSLDYAIMRIKLCNINSLDFYARYLFYVEGDYNLKLEGIKALVIRFEQEQEEDYKIKIYNILRPLVNLLTLEDVLEVLQSEELSILIGEYGRKNNFTFNELRDWNVCMKFLGFYSIDDFDKIENLDELVEKDKNILKIITGYENNHFYLRKVLKKDENLQFYLIYCKVNFEFLKDISFPSNIYSQYLLLNLLREEKDFVFKKLSLFDEHNLILIFSLFVNDKKWIKDYSGLLRGSTLEGFFCNPDSVEVVEELKNEILKNKSLDLLTPLELKGEESEVSLNFSGEFKNTFYFNLFNKLEKSIYFTNKIDLKEIDNNLFVNYCILELKVYLNNRKTIDISSWLDVKEVFFSQVVRKSFLKDFHFSFLLNKKKRNQLASDILKGENRQTFLDYLDKRGIYVDFNEIEYNFSVKWLNLYVEEHHKNLKIIFWDKQTEFIKLNELKINENKFKQLKIKRNKENKKENREDTKRIKKETTKYPLVSEEEIFFNKIFVNKEEEEEIVGFTQFGLLNKFISSHLDNPEGCAKVVSCVILSNNQLRSFFRTLEFVIENKKTLNEFCFNFLRFCRFEIKLSLILDKLDLETPLVFLLLPCKIEVNDLDYLISNYNNLDLINGVLLRSYSYLSLLPTKGNYKKVKDEDFVFYYSAMKYLKFKHQTLSFTTNNKEPERFYSFLKTFKDTNCSFKKSILKRIYKVVVNKIGEINFPLDIKQPPPFENNLPSYTPNLSEPPQDPFEMLNLLKTIRGEEETLISQSLKKQPLDQKHFLYVLNNFELFSFSTKIFLLTNFNIQINEKLFYKFCEVIANEDNLKIIKILLNKLKENKNHFKLIEQWKTNPKLVKLLIRIYPLSYEDKPFYANLFKNYKHEEEKKMLKEFYSFHPE